MVGGGGGGGRGLWRVGCNIYYIQHLPYVENMRIQYIPRMRDLQYIQHMEHMQCVQYIYIYTRQLHYKQLRYI